MCLHGETTCISRVGPHVSPRWDRMYLQDGTTCISRVGLHARPPEVRHSVLLFFIHTLPPLMPIVQRVGPMAGFSLILFDIISPSLCSPFLHNPPPFLCPPSASSNSPVCVSSDYFVQSLTSFRTERVTRDNTQLFCVFIDNCKSQTYLMYIVS